MDNSKMGITHQFIKEHGIEKARKVIEGAPDKTATHYVVDTDTYFSEEFHTYFDHSLNDWETADLHCVSDLEANYEFVLDISELKRLVESVDLVNCNGGWNGTKNTITLFQSSLDLGLYHGVDGVDAEVEIPRLKQAITDYEAIYLEVEQ